MNLPAAYALLLVAATLEAGGDALVRAGLGSSAGSRIGFLAAGAALLVAYGVVINSPPWDFGKLLGVYVTLFFLVAQIINVVCFGTRPDTAIVVGGALIVVGGLVITLGNPR